MSRKVMNCQGLCKFFRSGFRHIFLFFINISLFLMYVTLNPFVCQYFQRTFIKILRDAQDDSFTYSVSSTPPVDGTQGSASIPPNVTLS